MGEWYWVKGKRETKVKMNHKILFGEKQKFTQWWLFLLLCLPLVMIFLSFDWSQSSENINDSGNGSFSIILPEGFFVILTVVILTLLFFKYASLTVQIDKEKIGIKHLIFYRRTIYWKDVKAVKTVKYGFVGYGIRLSLNHGTVYNVKGNKGLEVTFNNGSKCLIGTQRPEELFKIANEQLRV